MSARARDQQQHMILNFGPIARKIIGSVDPDLEGSDSSSIDRPLGIDMTRIPQRILRLAACMVLMIGGSGLTFAVARGDSCPNPDQDCCLPHPNPGCADQDCCTLICSQDPFCCATEWDTLCVNAAGQSCGCADGDCCIPHGGLGCADSQCSQTVCLVDPVCCLTGWDATCVIEARDLCGSTCPTRCSDVPTPNRVAAEQCRDNTDGDCGLATQDLMLGDVIQGWAWAEDDHRDTDWYRLQLASPTRIKLEVYSKILCVAALASTSCQVLVGTSFQGDDGSQLDCPSAGELCVPAGQYRIFVAPAAFDGAPTSNCESPREDRLRYVLRVTGTPCTVGPPVNDRCTAATQIDLVPNQDGLPDALFPFDNRFAETDVTTESCGAASALFTNDLFWTFTPPAGFDGDYLLTTCSGGASAEYFDTGIEVRRSTGSGLCAATAPIVACNDDGSLCNLQDGSGLEFASSLYVNLSRSEGPYLIRVGGWNGSLGSATLLVRYVGVQPSCDSPGALECCSAHPGDRAPFCSDETCCQLICGIDAYCCSIHWDETCADYSNRFCSACGGPGAPAPSDECPTDLLLPVGGSVPVNNVQANTSFGGQSCVDIAAARDVYVAFVAPSASIYTFDTCEGDSSTEFDSVLEAWTACPSAGGALLACNDDLDGNCRPLRSSISVQLSPGQRIVLRVAGYGGSAGTAILRSAQAQIPGDLNADGIVNGADLGILLTSWSGSGAGDLNGDGTINGADLGILLTAWTP